MEQVSIKEQLLQVKKPVTTEQTSLQNDIFPPFLRKDMETEPVIR